MKTTAQSNLVITNSNCIVRRSQRPIFLAVAPYIHHRENIEMINYWFRYNETHAKRITKITKSNLLLWRRRSRLRDFDITGSIYIFYFIFPCIISFIPRRTFPVEGCLSTSLRYIVNSTSMPVWNLHNFPLHNYTQSSLRTILFLVFIAEANNSNLIEI